jgi:membrane protease YdiL (CAAX protease family)
MTQNYWLFVAGTLILTAFLSYNTYLSAQLLRYWRPTQNLILLPSENLLRLGLIALCIGLGWLSGLSYEQLGWRWPLDNRPALTGLLWGVGLALFFALTTVWVVQRMGRRFYSPTVVQAIVPRRAGELPLVLLAMIPAVLLEELLFRSLLIGGFSPIAPIALLAIGGSLLFGYLHSPQGYWGMIGAGMAGLLLSWLFLYYETLLIPLIAHYVTNVIQIGCAMHQQPTDL